MSGTIATHSFTVMVGQVPHIAGGTEIIERPGEDGYILRKIGLRAKPFQVQTTKTFADEITGINEKLLYSQLQANENGPWNFIKDGLNWSTEPTLTQRYGVWVLEIDDIDFSRKPCISGTTNRWQMELTWTLLLAPLT